MKKVAIAKEDNFVSGHFGHCEGFEVFEVDENKIISRNFIKNPGHRPGFLPEYLSEKGINVIISGGMGATAQELFNRKGISVIVGATGTLDDIIAKYLKGELQSTNSVCEEHMHHGHCNG